MFNKSFLNDVRNSLIRYKKFHENDFEVTETSDTSNSILIIIYRFDTNFYFKISISDYTNPSDADFRISMEFSPGILKTTEYGTLIKINDLKNAITAWTDRLYTELMDRPITRMIEENKKEIENILENINDLPDEYFTEAEVVEMRKKLDVLEKELLQKLAELDLKQDDFKNKQDALQYEINQLKDTVEVLKKPGWAGSLMVRISDWVKDSGNRKLLKNSVTEVVKQLVIEAGKKQLGS